MSYFLAGDKNKEDFRRICCDTSLYFYVNQTCPIFQVEFVSWRCYIIGDKSIWVLDPFIVLSVVFVCSDLYVDTCL